MLLPYVLLPWLLRGEAECPSNPRLMVQEAKMPHTELHGMDEAKEILREAVTLPLRMAQTDFDRIFWRSAERFWLDLRDPCDPYISQGFSSFF
eukprot:symbB.v1.2.018380.t1/scaffold1465.1/size117142/4